MRAGETIHFLRFRSHAPRQVLPRCFFVAVEFQATSSKTTMDPVTPSRPPVVVDISTIEQQKENIQPLASGRSAAQLASLSSLPRSGLGAKLAAEHKRYQTLIDALDVYQRQGTWIDGQDGLSLDEVAALAEDPLDIHHRYVRFVLDNYTAGASAASKLIPLLESSTRRFLSNKLYRNDPRYVRLWILYSKNMECPQDCFRFLFAKNIGDRIALLYEEYALFLEANGKYVCVPKAWIERRQTD